MKNISRNIGAVFFKFGTRNVHHKRKQVIPNMLFPWQYSWLQKCTSQKKENDARRADSHSDTYCDLCSCFDKLGVQLSSFLGTVHT